MSSTDFITIEGRRLRHIHLPFLLSLLTLGTYNLLLLFFPSLKSLILKRTNLCDATYLFINNKIIKINYFYFPYYSSKLKSFVHNKQIRYFEYNFVRFFYDINKHKFVLHKDEEYKAHLTKLVKKKQESNIKTMKEIKFNYEQKKFKFNKIYTVTKTYESLFFSDIELLEKYIVYGENSTQQKSKSNIRLLVDILVSPIFIYTMAGVLLWFNIEYEFNAIIILFMTGYSLVVDYMEELRKKREIERMAHKRDVFVYRNNCWLKVPHTLIYPGDVIKIDLGDDFVCDVKLVKGEVIVDESFLTGETVPVYKTVDSTNNIVYAGTNVLKTMGVRQMYEKKKIIPDFSQLQSEVVVKSIKKKNLKNKEIIKKQGLNKSNHTEKQNYNYSEIQGQGVYKNTETKGNNKDSNSEIQGGSKCKYMGNQNRMQKDDDNEIQGGSKDKHMDNQNRRQKDDDNEIQGDSKDKNTEIKGYNNISRQNNDSNRQNNNCNGQGIYASNYIENNIDAYNENLEIIASKSINIEPTDLNSINRKDTKNSSESNSNATGLVISTRFDTAKGRLFKNILVDTPLDFLFEKQCMKTIKITLASSVLLIAILWVYLLIKGINKKDSFCYSIDLIFCIMSPTLPATIWIGSSLAAQRLRKDNIRCNEANKINLAGKSDIVVFDKTGTLTEEGLDVLCIDDLETEYYDLKELSIENNTDNETSNSGSDPDIKLSIYNNVDDISEVQSINTNKPIIKECISVCHSVHLVDNELVGDPLDIKMFLYSESTIINKKNKRIIKEGNMDIYEGPILKEERNVEMPIYHYQGIKDRKSIEKTNVEEGNNFDKNLNVDEKNFDKKNNDKNFNDDDEKNIDKNFNGDDRKNFNKKYNEHENYIVDDENSFYAQDEEGIEVIKIFEFDNKLRRMTVITKNKNKFRVYVKGSPESLYDLFNEVPEDYDDTVKNHALDGFRVLALAYKEIDSCFIDRAEAENCLIFIGLIVFANKLKSETKGTLKELNRVGIKTLMATGDNILTAVSVGRQAKIIDKFTPVIFPLIDENAKSIYDAQWLCIGEEGLVFDKIKLSLHKGEDRISYSDFLVACEGREYEIIRQESKEYFEFIMSKGVIFARMNPDQKKLLMEDLNDVGYSTIFCGDGANDCGALKSAHVGIALAENEASIASTFISTVKNISCVISVIKEGRCALTTSYSRFQYMLLTCFIQFFSLYILSFMMYFLSDKQTAHFDILVVLPFTYFMTGFRPNKILSKTIPKFDLFSTNEVLRVLGHLLSSVIFMIIAIIYCKYSENEFIQSEEDFIKSSPIGQFIFFITTFQVIIQGYLFALGKPHRQARLSNKKFVCFIVATTILLIFVLFMSFVYPDGLVSEKYAFCKIKNGSKVVLCLMIFFNGLLAVIYDAYISKKSCTKNNDNVNEESSF